MTPEMITKLNALQAFTILHDGYSGALNTVHHAMEMSDILHENCGAILLGDPGTGKSRVCTQLIGEFPPPSIVRVDGDDQRIMPVLYCRVPNDATVRAAMARMLRVFDAYRTYQDQEALESCLLNALNKCQTKLLIMDEWPHLYRSGTAKAIKSAADFAKVLTDAFAGSILLVGESKIEDALNAHSALADRFPYRAHLRPFSLETPENWTIFAKVLRGYSHHLQHELEFMEVASMAEEKTLLAFYAATGGNFRGLFNLLKESTISALKRNMGDFTAADLADGCRRITVAARLTAKNPFELSIGEVKKIINMHMKKK